MDNSIETLATTDPEAACRSFWRAASIAEAELLASLRIVCGTEDDDFDEFLKARHLLAAANGILEERKVKAKEIDQAMAVLANAFLQHEATRKAAADWSEDFRVNGKNHPGSYTAAAFFISRAASGELVPIGLNDPHGHAACVESLLAHLKDNDDGDGKSKWRMAWERIAKAAQELEDTKP